jgi:hypothetical protein
MEEGLRRKEVNKMEYRSVGKRGRRSESYMTVSRPRLAMEAFLSHANAQFRRGMVVELG